MPCHITNQPDTDENPSSLVIFMHAYNYIHTPSQGVTVAKIAPTCGGCAGRERTVRGAVSREGRLGGRRRALRTGPGGRGSRAG